MWLLDIFCPSRYIIPSFLIGVQDFQKQVFLKEYLVYLGLISTNMPNSQIKKTYKSTKMDSYEGR